LETGNFVLFCFSLHFGSLLRTRLFSLPAFLLDNGIKPLLFQAVTRPLCPVRSPPSPFTLSPVVTDSHLPNTAALVAFSSQAVVTKNSKERKGLLHR
jgi:hypothetical protein